MLVGVAVGKRGMNLVFDAHGVFRTNTPIRVTAMTTAAAVVRATARRTRKPSDGIAATGIAMNTPARPQNSTEPLGSGAGPAANWLPESEAITANAPATAQLTTTHATVVPQRGRCGPASTGLMTRPVCAQLPLPEYGCLLYTSPSPRD